MTTGPGQALSHYRLLEKIGEGGMGVVYRAIDTKLNRTVAIKILPPALTADAERRLRFQREAQTAASLSHPNIAVIHEIGAQEDIEFIVMELVEGKTLREVIGQDPLPLREWLNLALPIAQGLSHAHKHGVVHRDLKPDNVILTREHQVKLLDFGLAKLLEPEVPAGGPARDLHTRLETISRELTQAGKVFGTVAYMSPEQARGEPVDHRSDLFSFGVVLYQMASGRLPFKGKSEIETLHAIIAEEPPPLSQVSGEIPPEAERVVRKAMEKEPERRYQDAADLAADLRNLQRDLDSGRVSIPSGTVSVPASLRRGTAGPGIRLLGWMVGGLALAAVLLTGILLLRGKVPASPEAPTPLSSPAANSLAVMYFDNVADPADKDRLAQMITSLLITDLSESRYMQVVSRQRLYDILKLLGKEGLKVIDRTVASEVAQKANVKWILTGDILQARPSIVLTSDISDAANGAIRASQRIAGAPGEDLFSVVDKLSAEIRKDLSLPQQAKQEVDRPVADVTTHSEEAYRRYLEGLDDLSKFYFSDAEKSFRKALQLDPTFAMAYLRLASMPDRSPSESRGMIAKALQYINKVSEREKYYIRSLDALSSGDLKRAVGELGSLVERYPQEKEALLRLGQVYARGINQPEKAIAVLTRAIEIDPLYKDAYNILAYAYDDAGNLDKSIWAINQYISLAPEEANPYDTRGDLYASNGKLDEAMDSYKKAVEKKPDFYFSWRKLGFTYLFKHDYTNADRCFRELLSSSEKGTRSEGRLWLAAIPLYQGKLSLALEGLEEAIGSDRIERIDGFPRTLKYLVKAFIHLELKDRGSALKEAERAVQLFRESAPYDPVYFRESLVEVMAESQQLQRAEETAAVLKKDVEGKDPNSIGFYWYAAGCIERARGEHGKAVASFQKAVENTPPFLFHIRFHLARAYLEAGRLGEAVTSFEKLLSRYDENRGVAGFWSVKAYYLLGLAYEKSGSDRKAIEKYQEFLEIWKNADPGIPEIEDARQRLARLRGKG